MKPDIDSLILYEDAHIIVCRKPAGIPTQTARVSEQDMVSLLKNHLGAAGHRQEHAASGSIEHPSAPYLAVIHRLDQPVEGLLVFAKTPAAAKDLNRQLNTSGFGKYYRAVVCGIPNPPEGTLEDYLVKDGRTNTSRVCGKNTPGAKHAKLHYRVEEICRDTEPVTSLVHIRLDTGRHHQIRVQMAHLGCPLAGDRKYGAQEPRNANGTAVSKHTGAQEPLKKAGPLRLCAYRLEFTHPKSGKQMIYEL